VTGCDCKQKQGDMPGLMLCQAGESLRLGSIQIVLGYLNGVFQDHLLKVDPTFLFPAEEHPFRKHSGFVYLVGSK
jgi:hypothetical protein